MFTTLLSNLQSLISTSFLVASFFPTLAFWFAHATMLFFFNAPFAEFVQSNLQKTAGLATIIVAAVLIAVAFTAYVVSALLPTMQSLMEGNWPQWIASLFAPSQMRRYDKFEKDLDENAILRGAFGTTSGGQSQAEAWQDSLTKAREVGDKTGINDFTKQSASAQQIAKLSGLRRHSRPIPPDDLRHAVTDLVFDLRAYNADQRGPDNNFTLEDTRRQLWGLIDYADQYAAVQFRTIMATRQSAFGMLPLAPTRMGNVAKSVQSYGIDRYNFNFELFWSRLQLPVQRDKDFGPVLKATKTQLDFLISCSALMLVWALTWAIWLYATSGPAWLFLATATGGPIIAYALYRVAVAQYRTLADLFRSSVDLFRLDLLAALQYQRPVSVDHERDLWSTIDAMHGLYEVRELPYAAPSKSS
jgi:hypothetical protein